MPTHMRSRFSIGEPAGWEPAEAFSFTKSLRTSSPDASVLDLAAMTQLPVSVRRELDARRAATTPR
jgi:hypothetical protein